jgi:ribosomal protein S18 acetylase RimI-like enzyme
MRIHRVWNTRPVSDVVVKPLAPSLHDDLMRFFDFSAYADNPHWSKCFCTWPLASSIGEHDAHTKEQNRATRSTVIRSGRGNGLVAYRLGRVVGWCHAAPKNELLNVEGEKDPKVGAIVCFVVAPDQRRQGVATTLLDAALEHLRKRGMTTAEAYPFLGEPDPARWATINYVGPLSMFVKAGFEVAEKHDDYAVVRTPL